MIAVILAGGKSSRMGSNKAFLKVKGKTFIEHQIDLLREIFNEVIISANTPAEYKHLNVPIIPDICPDKGPLGGIHSALISSKSFHAFMLACDMPFVDIDLIKHLKSFISGHDVVVPQSKKGLEPLHAFYSKNCIAPIKKELDNNNLRIVSFFPQVKVKTVKLNNLPSSNKFKDSIKNLNTMEEYKDAKKR